MECAICQNSYRVTNIYPHHTSVCRLRLVACSTYPLSGAGCEGIICRHVVSQFVKKAYSDSRDNVLLKILLQRSCLWQPSALNPENASEEHRCSWRSKPTADTTFCAVQWVIPKQAPQAECELYLRAWFSNRNQFAYQLSRGRNLFFTRWGARWE